MRDFALKKALEFRQQQINQSAFTNTYHTQTILTTALTNRAASPKTTEKIKSKTQT
jgi:hypothetical protein